MSDTTSSNPPTPDPMQALMQPWNEFWGRLAQQQTEVAQAMFAGTPPSTDPTQLRRRWFEAMTKSMDAWLRSPAFLEGMRRNFDQLMTVKSATDSIQKDAFRQAGIPQLADLASLAARVQVNHEETLARLGELERRLATLESKLPARRRN